VATCENPSSASRATGGVLLMSFSAYATLMFHFFFVDGTLDAPCCGSFVLSDSLNQDICRLMSSSRADISGRLRVCLLLGASSLLGDPLAAAPPEMAPFGLLMTPRLLSVLV